MRFKTATNTLTSRTVATPHYNPQEESAVGTRW